MVNGGNLTCLYDEKSQCANSVTVLGLQISLAQLGVNDAGAMRIAQARR